MAPPIGRCYEHDVPAHSLRHLTDYLHNRGLSFHFSTGNIDHYLQFYKAEFSSSLCQELLELKDFILRNYTSFATHIYRRGRPKTHHLLHDRTNLNIFVLIIILHQKCKFWHQYLPFVKILLEFI